MMSVLLILLAIGGGAVAVAVVNTKTKNGLARGLVQARATGDVSGLVAAIQASPESSRPTLWDQAIGALWGEYAREAATSLIMAGAQRSDASILQYWIKQVMEVEPEIAEAYFDEEFLANHYHPQVAASCGRCGCS